MIDEHPRVTIGPTGTVEWRLSDGRRHRLDGPALEWPSGAAEWWVEGRRHRIGWPAVYIPDGHEEMWHDGRLHATDRPAIRRTDGHEEWWLHDRMTVEQTVVAYRELPADIQKTARTLIVDGTAPGEAIELATLLHS